MFRVRALVRCAAAGATPSLTNQTATKSVSTKGKLQTKKAQLLVRNERLRRRRRERGKDLRAKEAAMKEGMESTTNARDVVMAQLADRIFSRGHKHLGSATNITFVPDGNPAMPTVAFAGRSQCGKTALLRALFRSRKEVGRSNRSARREAMNFFNVGDVFNVVDLPGFGGTSVAFSVVLQHAVLLRNFVRYQPSLKMLYYCMDVHYRHGVYVQDMDMLRFLSKEVPNFTIVITKAEQINGVSNFSLSDIRKELLYNEIHHPVIVTSAFRMGGVDTLRYDMVMNCLHALPTERLTITEARRLSERLLSQKELSTVRRLPIPPAQIDDEVRQWEEAVKRDEQPLLPASPAAPTATAVASTTGGEFDDVDADDVARSVRQKLDAMEENSLATVSSDDLKAIQSFKDPELQLAYRNVLDKVRNKGLMQFVASTSPWRNPLLWPANVVPTKHPKSNLMRCPEDPENPYLSQPTFVAPRADMCFRKPNVGVRRSTAKGRYEIDKPTAFLTKSYTIPFFPEIVDVEMHPQPWTFLGSREAYFERSSGRELGIKLSALALGDSIHALKDNPVRADEQPLLAAELKRLEQQRHKDKPALEGGGSAVVEKTKTAAASPIAMLRPPGFDDAADERD